MTHKTQHRIKQSIEQKKQAACKIITLQKYRQNSIIKKTQYNRLQQKFQTLSLSTIHLLTIPLK